MNSSLIRPVDSGNSSDPPGVQKQGLRRSAIHVLEPNFLACFAGFLSVRGDYQRIEADFFPGRILAQSFSVVLLDTLDVIRGES
jgi:hypothetical protein